MVIALADLVPVLIGLFALLALVGLFLIIRGLQWVINSLFSGGVLSFVAGTASNLLNDFGRTVEGWMSDVIHGVASFFTSVASVIERGFWETINSILNHASTIKFIIQTLIPGVYAFVNNAIGYLRNSIMAIISQVQANIFRDIGLVVGELSDEISSVFSRLVNALYATRDFLLGVISNAINAVNGFINNVMNFLLARIGQVTNFLLGVIGLQITGVRAFAEAVANRAQALAVQEATTWAKGYADAVGNNVATALNGAGAIGIAGELPDFRAIGKDMVDSFSDTLADALPFAGALAGINAAGIAEAVRALSIAGVLSLRINERCSMPLCKKLGGFSDEVPGLADAAIMGAMLALCVAAIEDPEPTANLIDEFAVEPLYALGSDFLSLVRSL